MQIRCAVRLMPITVASLLLISTYSSAADSFAYTLCQATESETPGAGNHHFFSDVFVLLFDTTDEEKNTKGVTNLKDQFTNYLKGEYPGYGFSAKHCFVRQFVSQEKARQAMSAQKNAISDQDSEYFSTIWHPD